MKSHVPQTQAVGVKRTPVPTILAVPPVIEVIPVTESAVSA